MAGKRDEVTIAEVAEALNISKTTVSRAISGKGRVSEATRARVFDYIGKGRQDAAAPLRALDPAASAAPWALRWVASHKNVKVVLSGMSAEDQLDDNLATFGDFRPMTDAENAAIRQTADVLRSHIKIGCTGCRYCMPCPMGVDIPDNFSIWNKLGMFGNKDAIRQQWTARFPDAEKAIHCGRGGKCEAVCPQHLPIRDSLAKLQTELDNL